MDDAATEVMWPEQESDSSETREVAQSSPPTCRRRVPERPRRENQRQRAMSTWEELRQNHRDRQRRDFTGKRVKKHNDARDLVSGKRKEKKHMFSKRQCSCHRRFVKNY